MRLGLLLSAMLIAFVVHTQLGTGGVARTDIVHVFGGGPVTKVIVRTSDPPTDAGGWETHSTTPSQIPGAVIDFVMPVGKRGFLLMRFSAAEWCQGPASQHCSVVIRVNGQEAHPRAGGNARFDSGSTENPESHSIERVLGLFPGGKSVRIQVMAETSNTALSFRVFEWTLVVEHMRTL